MPSEGPQLSRGEWPWPKVSSSPLQVRDHPPLQWLLRGDICAQQHGRSQIVGPALSVTAAPGPWDLCSLSVCRVRPVCGGGHRVSRPRTGAGTEPQGREGAGRQLSPHWSALSLSYCSSRDAGGQDPEGAPAPSARPGAPPPVAAAGKAGTCQWGRASEQVPPGQPLPTLASISSSQSLSLTEDRQCGAWGTLSTGIH